MSMQIDWKQVSFVAGAGGVGGLLSWVYSEAVQTPMGLGWLSPVASVCLGMGAAILGVYLVAKTDMTAALHGLVFAMACGFAWRPVLDGTKALVEARISDQQKESIDKDTETALRSSDSLRSLRGTDQEKALGETVRASIDALRVDPRRTDVIEDRSQRLEDVIRGIRSAEDLDVMSRIESLRKIGNAAAAAGDQSLTFMSMTAIAELSESSGTPPPVKKEAADAVQDIGERASQRMPAMGLNSDVIGEAIQPQAAAPVRSIFERRVPLGRLDHR